MLKHCALRVFSWRADLVCCVTCSIVLDEPFAGPVTLHTALSCFVDVLGTPTKDALLALGGCASDPGQAARLKLLGSTEGKSEYHEYILSKHRSLLEVSQHIYLHNTYLSQCCCR